LRWQKQLCPAIRRSVTSASRLSLHAGMSSTLLSRIPDVDVFGNPLKLQFHKSAARHPAQVLFSNLSLSPLLTIPSTSYPVKVIVARSSHRFRCLSHCFSAPIQVLCAFASLAEGVIDLSIKKRYQNQVMGKRLFKND
jgi:hypothetical protein